MPTVNGLPFDLHAVGDDVWDTTVSGVVVGLAPSGTDLYVNPGGTSSSDAASMSNAPRLLGSPGVGDFQLRARVTVDFAGTFDAGVLLLWVDGTHFAKFCFEVSPQNEPMVVSVVTRGVSDDANAFTVDGSSVWLRVSRIGQVYALHASLDGRDWVMVRVFSLTPSVDDHLVGFEVQSPMGEGCRVRFDDISFARETLGDFRNGE